MVSDVAIIVIASAGCAPGATTTALALALHWPRETVLVDADPNPTQAVLAGYLGGAVTDPGGLTAIAARHRARAELDVLSAALRLPTTEGPDQLRWFLPGVSHPGAAAVFPPVWTSLAPALNALHQRQIDAVIDVGRLGGGVPPALLAVAQVVLVVTRTSLRDLAAMRVHLPSLQQHHEQLDATAHVAVVVIGEGQPYTGHEIERVFGLPVWGRLADDPDTAAVYSDGEPPAKRHHRSPLVTSVAHMVEHLRGRIRPVTVGVSR